MSQNQSLPSGPGSEWARWDPHIHTPNTVLNDQFAGDDVWNEFFRKLNESEPRIRALGITDYLSIEQYEEVVRRRANGALTGADFVFPNVEMRFGVATASGSAVNVHLLFSPDDPDHVAEIKRFLERLTFEYQGDSYKCCKPDLIRLGKRHQPSVSTDGAALAIGSNQFKVEFNQLTSEWKKSEWVRRNCLVAVAAGQRDGTSGLRDDTDSFAALRKSIEAFAHIIFSGNPSQVDFWLGRRSASIEDLESKWGGMKPCLHGSDAHELSRVGMPDGDRYCWIKGDLSFESLRQACIEPEERVYIGVSPPRGSLVGKTITALRVANAPWMTPACVPLNSGLIAIIGARGSGKTALADLIATGGLAINARRNPRSFVVRAEQHLGQCRADLDWENEETTGNDLRHTDIEDLLDSPRVQYLSQQFVDDLCSAEKLSSPLVEEIEQVIFHAHPMEEQEGANSFSELRGIRLAPVIEKRTRNESEFESASDALAAERQLKGGIPALKKQYDELTKQIAQYQKDRKALTGKGQEERAKRHEELSSALDLRRRNLDAAQSRLRALTALQAYVSDIRIRQAPEWLRELHEELSDAELAAVEWDLFKLSFPEGVDRLLEEKLKKGVAESKAIAGSAADAEEVQGVSDPAAPLIANDADLSEITVTLLHREVSRLGKLIGIDAQNTKKFVALSERLAKLTKAQEKLAAQIARANTADVRIEALIERRRVAYTGIFGALVEMEAKLGELYAPLAKNLRRSIGPLSALGFAVRRKIDIEQWAAQGEELLDLRKTGPFKGRGALLEVAKSKLLAPWQSGTPEEASTALSEFIRENEQALRTHKPEMEENRKWISTVSKWLHDTSHIKVSYGIQYDGVDIESLSPGTRGIVLLLLYLAIDEEDDRPLIIDQPEENLDPQSIFDELVTRFRTAKKRRQIIIVTHNANLVVNTDADQVIVATAGKQKSGELPQIQYESGGLENPRIRKRVCDILEGGERAFKARAKRLRLGLDDSDAQQVAVGGNK
jgi:hypothetical protein